MKRMLVTLLAVCLMAGSGYANVFGAEVSVAGDQGKQNESYDAEAAKNIAQRIDEYAAPYLGTDTLTDYDNGRAVQCHAFTNYIWRNVFGYDVYSSKCKRTEASTDYENLGEYVNTYGRPGDMLRVDAKHSMVITSFDKDGVTGYDWLVNKKERECTYTWEGVKNWGDGTQTYWLYQIDDSVYKLFEDKDYKNGKTFGPEADEGIDTEANGDKDGRGDEDKTDNKDSDPEVGKIVVQIDNPVMTANGEYKNIDESGTVPVIVNERTVLPIRAIVEAMGGTVGWNNDTRTVGLNYKNVSMELTIDSSVMKVNGNDVQMDVAPVIINERTMLPIRYITENFGGKVEWFDNIRAVAITY